MSTKKSFENNKSDGDKLEFEISPAVIKELYPDCTIKSPDDTGIYRDEDGQAIPDHTIINQDGKTVIMFESKYKTRMYGNNNDIFSCDEKVFDYRTMSKKHNVDCCLIFYCEAYDKNNVYIVNVNVEPDHKREVNNEHGKWMYGYHVHLTKKHPIPKPITKHNDNIRDPDVMEACHEKDLNKKRILVSTILDRCEPERSNKPMRAVKLREMRRELERANTPIKIDNIIVNLMFKGEGLGMNSPSYNRKIYG